MLDVVFLAMFAVIPIMGWSIYQVKFNRRYQLHKTVQLILGAVLLVAVTLFEFDIQWSKYQDLSWMRRAAPETGEPSAAVWTTLYIHLVFAVSTTGLWIFVIVQALRKIPKPPRPCEYSGRHLFWGKLAALDMFMTALTGWVFYLLAFAL